MSLRRLGELTWFDFGYLGQIERGERGGSAEVAARCDEFLKTGGALSDLFVREDKARMHGRRAEPTPAHAEVPPETGIPPNLTSAINLGRDDMKRRGFLANSALALSAAVAWPSGYPQEQAAQGRLLTLNGPGGRLFAGSSIPAIVLPAVIDGHILADIPDNFARSYFLRRPERSLIAGQLEGDDNHRLYAVDTRYARQRLARATTGARLLIPDAYVLDELTIGLLWAVTNLDDSLLGDDAALGDGHRQLAGFGELDRSAAGRDAVADLTPVSQAWLGSDFCARHITRHYADLRDVPVFWTCERRGEEASCWLFFTHKYAYLESSSKVTGNADAQIKRAFCVPPEAVSISAAPERLLLLLTAALMESFGIRVDVCTDPEYTQVEGFVSDRSRAIVANWVESDSLWYVDVTTDRPALRELSDASGHANAHSVTKAPSPPDRLREFAGYLDLDWSATTRRCAELGEYGLAGLVAPRSRLLSIAGAERACQFIGKFQQ
jgi:hypothetical protein